MVGASLTPSIFLRPIPLGTVAIAFHRHGNPGMWELLLHGVSAIPQFHYPGIYIFTDIYLGMESRKVVFFKGSTGKSPVSKWLRTMPEKALDLFGQRIQRMKELGKGDDRPRSAYLQEGIYEFRFKYSSTNYRALFFFHGKTLVVVTNGFVKDTAKVPEAEIQRAKIRRSQFLAAPGEHTCTI